MLSVIQDLTSAFNGYESFPDPFDSCIRQNLIETGSAIRFNDYELDDINGALKEEGLKYMHQVMPTFIERAARSHPDIPLTNLINHSFKAHARDVSFKNDGTTFEWYKTFLKLIIEANKTTSLSSSLEEQVEVYSEYLKEDESNLLEAFIIASENYFGTNEKNNIPDMKFKISNHEESSIISHLKSFSDYMDIEAQKELTPAQKNLMRFEYNNIINWVFKSALSEAHIFVMDNTVVKKFIEQKGLVGKIQIPDEVKKIHNIAKSLFPDDPIAIKDMLYSHFLNLPKDELSVSDLEL